jgi:hypothetical protein
MITNIQSINLANDGKLQRVSIMWDELNDEGKTISTNNRATRVVTDDEVLNAISIVEEYAQTVIKEI